MPLDREAMRAYQRDRRQKAKTETGKVGHEHYWRRRAGEEFATCVEFEYQGRTVGGCGEERKYDGKLLPTSDEHPDLAQAIIDSPRAKEIQQKMPVTKARER